MGTKIMYVGKQLSGDLSPREFLCDTDADFTNLPESCVGSTAVSIESGKVMVVNTEGNWVEFGVPAKPSVDDSVIAGIWLFNDDLNFDGLEKNFKYPISFKIDSAHFSSISVQDNLMGTSGVFLTFWNADGVNYTTAYATVPVAWLTGGWDSTSYKNITILEEPTDAEFITWLKANATKVG